MALSDAARLAQEKMLHLWREKQSNRGDADDGEPGHAPMLTQRSSKYSAWGNKVRRTLASRGKQGTKPLSSGKKRSLKAQTESPRDADAQRKASRSPSCQGRSAPLEHAAR